MRMTKIVATIGPASDPLEMLTALLNAGVDVARLNFSHGSHEEHRQRVANIRAAAEETGKNLALMLDTKGPEIRTGTMAAPLLVNRGDRVVLTSAETMGSDRRVPVNYKGLKNNLAPGERILIDDGTVELKVEAIEGEMILCRAENHGEIGGKKGVNIPGREVDLPAVTDKDKEDLAFAIREDMDYIAASFVRNAGHVLEIRRILEEAGSDIKIIAKIESQAGVDNLDSILQVADGIMVARGDLGVEIPMEQVPMVQKHIIESCNEYGKPVITATQMLDSMIRNPRPTRAEATDVANAILDGSDCVMLSGETAAGKYPLEAVKAMADIIGYTESQADFGKFRRDRRGPITITDAICRSASVMVRDLRGRAIIVPTTSGYTARMMARFRPEAPIIAVSPDAKVIRGLTLVWGVHSLWQPPLDGTDETIDGAMEKARLAGYIQGGDLVIVSAGAPVGFPNTTNLLKVEIVGSMIASGTGIGRGVAVGKARVIRDLHDLDQVEEGDILLVHATDKEMIPALEKAAGCIAEEGGLTSHAAIAALNFGIPAIIGVENALELVADGTILTINGRQGSIYLGTAQMV